MSKKLSTKQELFCLEYMKDMNATQAAIRSGYSEKTASEIGYENLRKPHLAEKIQRLKNEIIEKEKLDLINRIKINKAIATANVYDYIDEMIGGVLILKDKDDLTIEQQLAIKGFKQVGSSIVPEFWDKHKSLDHLGKILGDFEEDNKQKGELSGEIVFKSTKIVVEKD